MSEIKKRGRGNPGTPRPTAGRKSSAYITRRGVTGVKVSQATKAAIDALAGRRGITADALIEALVTDEGLRRLASEKPY